MKVHELVAALKVADQICADRGMPSRATDLHDFVAAFDGFETLAVEDALQRISAGRRRRLKGQATQRKKEVASVLAAKRSD
jgi:hypothetical protein